MSDKIKIQIDEDLKSLIPEFFSNLEKDIDNAVTAISSQDSDQLEKVGHKSRGTCGSYGFLGLEQLFSDLETCAKNGDFSDATAKVEKIRGYISEVEIEYIAMDDDE